MAAHWVVIAAAALTTLVAAAVAAALAVFAGQALPQAVRHDLVNAPGNSMVANGPFGNGDAQSTSAALRSAISGALPGVPIDFWSGTWSDPLGLVPGALPARPASAGPGTTPLLAAAALDAVTSHAVLVAGAWPAPGSAPSVEIPAALPATSAALLRVHVGDVLRLQDRTTMAPVTFTITGLYAQRQLAGTAAAYWQLDSLPASGSSTASGFITYGPLIVPPTAFPARLAAATGTWVAQPDLSSISDTELSALSADVTSLEGSVNSSNTLSGIQLTSNLSTLLADIGSNLALARSLLAISGLQLLVLAVAALLAVAQLLATQREGETALLIARGATRWQLIRLTAAEVVPLSILTALAGGVAGSWLARWLGGSLYGQGSAGGSVASGGISLTAAGTWTDALAATVLVVVLAIGALLYPMLRPESGASRVRRGRQAALAGAARAGADVALIALAILADWQLRRYSAVATSSTGAPAAIDPVLALAPALALAGGTVLTLRLLPAAARAADRLAAAGRGLTAAMAGWQFSRQPLRQGGAALLIVMAVATGTLALAQHQSWTRSTTDQAAYTAGADVRVDLATPLPPASTARLTHAAGVTHAMAVADDQDTLPVPVIAVNSAQAAGVVPLRADQSPLPPARLLHAISPTAAAGGTAVPGHPADIQLVAVLSRAPLGPATVALTVTDATGGAFQVALSSTLPADGRPHRLTAQLGESGFAYPLRIAQLTATYTMPETPYPHSVTLTITGTTLTGWGAVASAPELDPGAAAAAAGAAAGAGISPAVAGLQPAASGGTVTFSPGFGTTTQLSDFGVTETYPVEGQVTLTAGNLAPSVVPAIATTAFDDANHTRPGQTVSTNVNGITFPVRIVAQVGSFPTVTGGGLIMDLTTLQSLLIAQGGAPVAVTQWWLATAGHGVPPALTAALPPGASITSRTAVAAATEDDPLSAAPQQALLAVTAAAALLAITGFLVSIAANVRQRRAENALLAALGVPQRSAAAQLFLEKLLLSVPAALLGLVLGTVVARLLVPAVTLTTTAQPPVPPAITLLDLPQTVPLAVAVAVLPALAAALVVFRRPDPAAELRAAEAA
jgi:ABC-type antimicrobial peptide transport system permease subunit